MSEDHRSITKCVRTLLASVSEPFLFHIPSLLDFRKIPTPLKKNHLKFKMFCF